jgi:hypothetical protein
MAIAPRGTVRATSIDGGSGVGSPAGRCFPATAAARLAYLDRPIRKS